MAEQSPNDAEHLGLAERGDGGDAQGIRSPIQFYKDLLDQDSDDDQMDGRKQSIAWAHLPEHASIVNSHAASEAVLFPLHSAFVCADETKQSLPEIESALREAAKLASSSDDIRLTLRPMPEEDDLPIISLENEAYETNRRVEIDNYCRELTSKFAQIYRTVTDRAISFNYKVDTNDPDVADLQSGIAGTFLVVREWARRVTCASIWTSLMIRPSTRDDEYIIQSFKKAMVELMEYFQNQTASRDALMEKMHPVVTESSETLTTWQELKHLFEEEQAVWSEQEKAKEVVGSSKRQLMEHKVKMLESSIDQMKKEREHLREMLREMETKSRDVQQKNGIPEQPPVSDKMCIGDLYEHFMANFWRVLESISDRTELGKDCIVTANWELFLMQKKLKVLQLRKQILLRQLQKEEPDTIEWLQKNMFSYSREDVERQKTDLIRSIEVYVARREQSSRGLPAGYLKKNPKIRREFQAIDRKIINIHRQTVTEEEGQRRDESHYAALLSACESDIVSLKKKRDKLLINVEERRSVLDKAKKLALQLEKEVHGKPVHIAEVHAEARGHVDIDVARKKIAVLKEEKERLDRENKMMQDELVKEKDVYKALHAEYSELLNRDNKLLEKENTIKTEAADVVLNALREERENEALVALKAQGGGGTMEQMLMHEYIQLKEKVKLVQRLISRANRKIAYHKKFEETVEEHLKKAATKYQKLDAANRAVLKDIEELKNKLDKSPSKDKPKPQS